MKVLLNNSVLAFREAHEVVEKSYISTTQVGQYIVFTGTYAADTIKIEAKFKASSANVNSNVLSGNNNIMFLSVKNTTVKVRANGSGTILETAFTENEDNTVLLNGYNGKCTVNGVELSGSSAVGSTINYLNIFNIPESTTQNAGIMSIKSIKIIKVQDDEVLHELVPATFDGIPCLYDKITGQALYEANGGTLSVV